jgi:hypothetical protein
MVVVNLLVLLWLDGVPPPCRLEVHLHQYRPLLIVGVSEHRELSAGGGVLRDGVVDHDLASPSARRW